MFLKRIFNYLAPLWIGKDRRISLRSTLAIAFSIDFITNLRHAIFKWEAGRSLEGLSLTLGIEAGLIVGLLGLSTYQNLATFGKTDTSYTDNSTPKEKKDNVEKEEGKPGLLD